MVPTVSLPGHLALWALRVAITSVLVFLGCRSVSLRTRAVFISLHIHIPTRTDFVNSRRHRYQEPKGDHECKHYFLPMSLQAIDGRVGLSVIFIEHIRIK